MKFSYRTSRSELTRGAKRHFNYRGPVRRVVGPLMGAALVVGGVVVVVSTWDLASAAVGGGMIGLGVTTGLRRTISVRKTVKAAFKGRPEGRTIECVAEEGGLQLREDGAESKCTWDSFVDCRVCEDGILLYPQRNLFFWLPASVEFSTGSWGELTTLVAASVTKKV